MSEESRVKLSPGGHLAGLLVELTQDMAPWQALLAGVELAMDDRTLAEILAETFPYPDFPDEHAGKRVVREGSITKPVEE